MEVTSPGSFQLRVASAADREFPDSSSLAPPLPWSTQPDAASFLKLQ